MIKAKTVSGARTAVVCRYQEAVMTEVMHRVDLILCHCAKGIVDLAFPTLRFAGVPISAQIGQNH